MRFLITLLVLSLALTACSAPLPPVGTAGTPAVWGEVCSEANNGQRFSLEGYFSYSDSFSAGRAGRYEGRALIFFVDNLEAVDKKRLIIFVSVGQAAGQVHEPPTNYSLEDIAVTSHAGDVLAYGDLARLSFTVTYKELNPLGEPTCDYDEPFLIESLAGSTAEATEAANE